ncbi:MAG: outer membrane protein assembly factor BamA [Bacteroidota bacterium]
MKINCLKISFILCFVIFQITLFSGSVFAQVTIGGDEQTIDYANPVEYEIGGIVVEGTNVLDKNVLILTSGLTVGEKIPVPGEKINKAIENLWDLNLFSNIDIVATKIQGKTIFLKIKIQERPRLSRFSFTGVKKSEADDLREKINLTKGKIVTENLIVATKNKCQEFFVDKGYLNCKVDIDEQLDSLKSNSVTLVIKVKKNKRIKINEIQFEGNTALSNGKMKRLMKETKEKHWYNVFKSSKFIEENFTDDKLKIIDKYNSKGFRDAKIVMDTVYRFNEELVNIKIKIDEGRKFYFRNITWVGNAKHSTEELNRILGIKKGDVFNQALLDQRLFMSQDSRDVTSLYMDDGYLFFQVTPVEVFVENDSIDYEMRIYEGKQAIINKVIVMGNTKTNDKVIMREIRTKPGQLFSRADIIRSQRDLSQLRYFNAEKMGVNPKPNPVDGTVDIEYTVEEQPSDQIELSGGWGANRIVGTLGVSFNNFSTKNFFKKNAWKPLPAGDGQTMSIRAQSNGLFFQSYNATFIEPWLGGKKPNSLSVTVYHTVQSNGVKKSTGTRQSLTTTGVALGLGKRLKVPDDYFQLYQELNYQHFVLNKFSGFINDFTDGISDVYSYKVNLTRSSIDAPIYPRKGSQISATLQLTPPYSYFRKDSLGNDVDYGAWTNQEKYKLVEYHKWKFSSSWFTELTKNLVLNTKVGFGILGGYNKQLGISPFERFRLGGSGLTGFNLTGTEIIALRGYDDGSLSAFGGATTIAKYTAELRYPVSLNPQATIYGLAFAEAGNSWSSLKYFNPYDVKRSAGVGVRIFLPMFGLLGLDYGWRFDEVENYPNMKKSQFHFTIGMNIGDL